MEARLSASRERRRGRTRTRELWRPGCAGCMHKKVAAQVKFYLRARTCDRIFSKFEIAVRHIVGSIANWGAWRKCCGGWLGFFL